MVVVNGVRYRPEDVPKVEKPKAEEPDQKAAPKPANKARTAANK